MKTSESYGGGEYLKLAASAQEESFKQCPTCLQGNTIPKAAENVKCVVCGAEVSR